MIISIDFGHKDDVAVETIFRKDKNGLTILSQKVISRADDFNTEEKINTILFSIGTMVIDSTTIRSLSIGFVLYLI